MYQDLTRGRKIAPDVKQAIRGTPFADKGAELDALASMDPADQRQAVELVQDESREDIATFRDAKQFIDGTDEDERDRRVRVSRANLFSHLAKIVYVAETIGSDANVEHAAVALSTHTHDFEHQERYSTQRLIEAIDTNLDYLPKLKTALMGRLA